MDKLFKKTSTILLTAGMLCMSTPVYAYTKDETVYAKLNNNGTVNHVIVSEYLKNTENTINDLTNLSDINNINGDEEIKKDGNKLAIVSNGKDILYQGTSSEVLPLSLNITYKLDGKEISLDDMLGKSGKVEITLKYSNLDSHYVNVNGRNTLLYTPFVVTTSTIISSKNNTNITVSNGKVVNNGSSNVIAAISTPGLYDSLKLSALKNMDTVVISYDTTNFELSSIYSVATSKLLSSEDLDVFDDMDSVYSLVNELSDNSTLIVNGSNDLVTNYNLFNQKFSEFNSNMEALLEGANLLKSNYAKINYGINTLYNSTTSLETLVGTIDSLSKLSSGITQGMNGLSKSYSDEVVLLESNINSLKNIIDNITDEDIKNSLQAEVDKLNTDLVTLKSINANLNGLNTSLVTLNGGLTKLNMATSSITDQENGLIVGIKVLKAGSDEFSKGLDTFTYKTGLITKGSNDLFNASNELNSGIAKLNTGITEFDSKGIQSITSYVNTDIKSLEKKSEALINLANNYDSYGLKNNDVSGTTKFVYVIDGVKKEEKKETVRKVEKKESIWDKLANLF